MLDVEFQKELNVWAITELELLLDRVTKEEIMIEPIQKGSVKIVGKGEGGFLKHECDKDFYITFSDCNSKCEVVKESIGILINGFKEGRFNILNIDKPYKGNKLKYLELRILNV